MVSFEALDNLNESLLNGSCVKSFTYSLLLCSNERIKTQPSAMTVLSSKKQDKEGICCIFPASMMEINKIIDKIFDEETAKLMESKRMKRIFRKYKYRFVMACCTNVCNQL